MVRRVTLRDPRDTLRQRIPACDQPVDRGERVEVDEIEISLVEALPRKPLAMSAAPGCAASGVYVPVA
jgi:hypothetical protein